MTTNKDFTIVEDTVETTDKTGLEIIEEDEFDDDDFSINENVEKFYEEHEDAIDFLGGFETFEAILKISDEEFETLRPEFTAMILNMINESAVERELRYEIITKHYTLETIEEEFTKSINVIDKIDNFGTSKKDFLKEICTIVANKTRLLINDLNKSIYIPCELKDNVPLPTYAHETDAGLDIYAREEITIAPGETKIIGTGIKTAIPEGYAILIQPRSGQSVKTKLRIANTPGLIDSGYRDEIGVIIENIEPPFKDIDYEFDENGKIQINSILHGNSYTIAEGQRFAQMRLVQVPKAEFVKVESVGEIGEDRGGGFGSSGQ